MKVGIRLGCEHGHGGRLDCPLMLEDLAPCGQHYTQGRSSQTSRECGKQAENTDIWDEHR